MNNNIFSIIIPNYNVNPYLEKCIKSVLDQTFTEYELIIVDDMSTDDSVEKIKNILNQYPNKNTKLIESKVKVWNGGGRNIGIKASTGEYILYLDNDDWFDNENCLQYIYNTIQKNDKPDLIRLSYYCLMGDNKLRVNLQENNPKDLVNSLYVAPWTKCVKRELAASFPENTLIEDVVQHIAQTDKISSIAICPEPIVVWNRNNTSSCSLKENKHWYNGKRISSVYRNIADLMDLICSHDYCEEHRQWRIQCYKNIVREGKEETF